MSEDYLFSMNGIEEITEREGHLSDSCHVGQMAEMILATEAAKKGFSVFFPVGHSHKADLILWKPPRPPITIQVKKATLQKRDGAFKFMVGSGKPSCASNPNNYGLRYTPYQRGDFDFLCAYIAEHESFAFYDLEEIAGSSCKRWRPNNGDRQNNWDILE